ncbi:MAG: DUF1735 domain-containing protein [Prevotella sp.]|nr:DUF1735 domain-containing protein [Prevotella sp.]
MERIIYILLISLFLFSCSDDDKYPEGSYFSLAETGITFESNDGQQTVELINVKGEVKTKVITEDAGWCTVSVSGNSLVVKVTASTLFKGRTANIEVTSGDEKVNLMVRQEGMEYTNIPKVENLEAIPGRGEITLKWDIPKQDNFSHVIITYEKKGQEYKIILDQNIKEYTVKELMKGDGEHTFYVQSIDKDWKYGPIAQASATPDKLVAIRFESEPKTKFLPHYLAETNTPVLLRIGSLEFYENEQSIVNLEIDEELLAKYNKNNSKSLPIIPLDRIVLPQDYVYTGTQPFQDMIININTIGLKDRDFYALPLKISSVAPGVISEIMSEIVIEFYVDDLEGWYTVDRLEKCGEGAGSYPSDPNARRRYIKRTGSNTWETGYLFNAYSSGQDHRGNGGTNIQFITLDTDTKKIHIQQNGYGTSDDRNAYDPSISELHIEYLYSAWAGWWTHERMYNRSMSK